MKSEDRDALVKVIKYCNDVKSLLEEYGNDFEQYILVNAFRCRLIGLANAISVRLRYQKRQLIAFASIRKAGKLMQDE